MDFYFVILPRLDANISYITIEQLDIGPDDFQNITYVLGT